MKLSKLSLALVCAFWCAGLCLSLTASAATLGPSLGAKTSALLPTDSVGTVIVAFNNVDGGLTTTHLDALRAAGLTTGQTLPTLGMVAVNATVAQVNALAGNPAVRSIWANDPLNYYMHEARVLTGVDQLQSDPALTLANGGTPVFGSGDFSVVINDSGIDATHADLMFGDHVVQNVQIVADQATSSALGLAPSLYGFTPLVFVENVPNTDTHIGHGTHCAGIVGGSGVRSGGLYRGVAPGARLIGCGSGAVEFILAALGGFEWSLANQPRYHIRVISNSWGGTGAFDPADPINIATKTAHDRNITVVFAAGNNGPAPDTMNPYAKAPWVIGVAAGTKEGGLASFSSRGVPKDQRLANSDPNDDFNAPTVTAPGTGREFATDAGKFTAAIVSTRSSSNVVANGLTSDTEIPPAYLPFYTQISGTSMATPHIAGVVALMLNANPLLTPDQVKQILVDTATAMPGYAEWEVGAGYVNAWAAVDNAFNLSKPYASLARTSYNAQVTTTKAPTETFTIAYSPTATPGPDSSNARHFTISSGTDLLEVAIQYGNTDLTLFGNILILRLYSPDGHTYSNAGSVLFVTDTPRRYVRVVSPPPGDWVVEVRGARGLAAVPQATSPVALALPDQVNTFIDRTTFNLPPVSDIAGTPYESEIIHALKHRYLDTFGDNTFRPWWTVTRADFADAMTINTPLRQAVNGATFPDATGSLQPLAAAITAQGATLRHFDYRVDGLLAPVNGSFLPNNTITRLELAVALVRALGQDAQARALAGTAVTATDANGNSFVVADLADIPADQRGYAQIALNKGFLTAVFLNPGTVQFRPSDTLSRGELAAALNSFRDSFSLE
ncbi:S8 family serine peptidase [Opitutus sp. GAS368]|uniref:S8 family serine peptidase n=1 Tax=Opitutus sp. GAS368 TaxID=1882749 RepID=UPI00087DE2E1|nr:S8 family serine peptidase [Opitutus sp. GAS368]SDS41024.1 serine protease AprX [Opitutus sp. GAS368]